MEVSPSCIAAATLWAHLLRTSPSSPYRDSVQLPLAARMALERLGLPRLADITNDEDSDPVGPAAPRMTSAASSTVQAACCCPGSRCYAAACVRPGAGAVLINRVPAAALPCCGRFLGRAYRGRRLALRILDADIAKGGADLIVPNVAFFFESSAVAGPSPFDIFAAVEVWNAGPLGPLVVAHCLVPALASCGARAIRSSTTHLTIGECAMDAATLSALAGALKGANSALAHLGLEFLTPLPAPRSSHAEITAALLELLQSVPSLTSLSLKGSHAVFFPSAPTTISPVEASDTISRTANSLRLARESGMCPLLTHLNVSYCDLDATAIAALVSAVALPLDDSTFTAAAAANRTVAPRALSWHLNLSSNTAACGDTARCAGIIRSALEQGVLVSFALGGGAIPKDTIAAAQRALVGDACAAATVEVADLSHSTAGGCSVRDVVSLLRSLRHNQRSVSRLRLLNCGHILDQHGTVTAEALLLGVRKSETFLAAAVAATGRRRRSGPPAEDASVWTLWLRNAGVGDLVEIMPGGGSQAVGVGGRGSVSGASARRKGGVGAAAAVALSGTPVGDAIERCPALGLALFMIVELDLTHTQLSDRHVRALCDALVGTNGCRSQRLEAQWVGSDRHHGFSALSTSSDDDSSGSSSSAALRRGVQPRRSISPHENLSAPEDSSSDYSSDDIDVATAATVAARSRQLRVLRMGSNRLTELSAVYLARALSPPAKRPLMVPHLHTIDLSLTETFISKKNRAAGVTQHPTLVKALVDLFLCASIQHLSVANSDLGPFVVEAVVLGAQAKLTAPIACPSFTIVPCEIPDELPPAGVPLMLNLQGNCAGAAEVDLMMRLPLWARDPSSGLAAGRLRIFAA